MALNNNATLVVGTGHYYKAPADTPIAADLATVSTPWVEIGHTSLEDILTSESEGGEATVLGTLQNPNLRTTYSKRTESFSINLQQFDEEALKLYYGANAKMVNKVLQIPSNPQPTRCAFLAVFKDGENLFAIYMPLCEIIRGDDMELSDTESFATLPLSIRPLQSGNNDWTYAITPLGTVAA